VPDCRDPKWDERLRLIVPYKPGDDMDALPNLRLGLWDKVRHENRQPLSFPDHSTTSRTHRLRLMRACACASRRWLQDYKNADDLLCEATIVLPAGRGELHHTFEHVAEGKVDGDMPSVRVQRVEDARCVDALLA
jgi:hypothetical protein